MNFHQPKTVEEAVALLASEDDARCLAGGATLVAMMNAMLVEPGALISLAAIESLRGIARADDGGVRIGAMTRHKDVAAAAALTGAHEAVREAAGVIGHPAIRNMGTIGGSICHADPSADYPTALMAADAAVEIAGPDATREVPAGEFFVDYFETVIGEGELVSAVVLPQSGAGTAGAYEKFSRVDGDFATVSAAVAMAMEGDRCSYMRIGIGACAATPVRVEAAEAALVGSTLDDAAIAEAGRLLAEACDPVDDFRGSGEYRMMILPEILRRAVAKAQGRLEAVR